MNVNSYWADEDDWDDEFCYRELSPFDNSAAGFTLASFLTAAQNADTPRGKSLLHIDYAKAETSVTVLENAQILKETKKALYIRCDTLNTHQWIPKSVVVRLRPLTVKTWFAKKLYEQDIIATPGEFEGLCPYCGGQHCDCGKEVHPEC